MQINTNNGSSFPDQVVPDEVKESLDYGRQVGRAIEGDWFSGTRTGISGRYNTNYNNFRNLRLALEKEQINLAETLIDSENTLAEVERSFKVDSVLFSKEIIVKNDFVDMTLISSSKKNKGRVRKSSEVDIWKVYRMNRNEGINKLQIAKKLFGFTTNPAYDYTADAHYQQVKRALEKAHQIIQATEKAARSRINQ